MEDRDRDPELPPHGSDPVSLHQTYLLYKNRHQDHLPGIQAASTAYGYEVGGPI